MITTSTLNDLLLYLYNELEDSKVQPLLSLINSDTTLLEVFNEWVSTMMDLDALDVPSTENLEARLIQYSASTKAAQI
ncbi:MAG: hypothetical protein SNJ77_12085 [Cytophagales bacterium]